MTVNDQDLADMINEELLERRTKVMFLRNAGATLTKIAQEVGVSVGTVRKDLAIVRRDINNEQPEDVIARHRAVIFDIQRANYPAMMRGDKDAAATILRALDREAKLLGLDAPTRVLAGVSDIEFANEAARLIERITALDPSTLKELEHVRPDYAVIDAELAEAEPVDTDAPAVVAGPERQAEGESAEPGPDPAGADGGRRADGDRGPGGGGGIFADDDGWSNI